MKLLFFFTVLLSVVSPLMAAQYRPKFVMVPDHEALIPAADQHRLQQVDLGTEVTAPTFDAAKCAALVGAKGNAPQNVKIGGKATALTWIFRDGCTFAHFNGDCIAVTSVPSVIDANFNAQDPVFKINGYSVASCTNQQLAGGCYPACRARANDWELRGTGPNNAGFKTTLASINQHRGIVTRNYLNFNWNWANLHRKSACAAGTLTPLSHGSEYYPALASAINKATDMIAIAGWKINVNIRLVRTPGATGPITLKEHLAAALKRSPKLKIFVILFPGAGAFGDSKTGQTALNFEPFYANAVKDQLTALAPGRVTVYLASSDLAMSHHGKYVSIDYGKEAFVGGIDLATEPSRYDTADHFPPDVNNKASMDERADVNGSGTSNDIKARKNPVDQPGNSKNWHDVAMRITSPDLAKQYWRVFLLRYLHVEKSKDIFGLPFPSANPTTYQLVKDAFFSPPSTTAAATAGMTSGWCKMVCSMSVANGLPTGQDNADHSIGDAWVEIITNAKKYIHIEQQYFISKGGWLDSGLTHVGGAVNSLDIQNPVLNALVDRIAQAYRAKENFHVSIVLPFEADSNAHANMRRTLSFFANSVRTVLGATYTDDATALAGIEKYVSIYGMRSWRKTPQGKITTSGVYVHSKMILVDDTTFIIGSANINDRSLLGTRDHEMGVYAHNPSAAMQLRNSLFSEHLGKPVTNSDSTASLQASLLKTGKDSAACYQKIFGDIPTTQPAQSKVGNFFGALKKDIFGFQQVQNRPVNFEEKPWSNDYAAVCPDTLLKAKIVSYPWDLWKVTFSQNTKGLMTETLTKWGAY